MNTLDAYVTKILNVKWNNAKDGSGVHLFVTVEVEYECWGKTGITFINVPAGGEIKVGHNFMT